MFSPLISIVKEGEEEGEEGGEEEGGEVEQKEGRQQKLSDLDFVVL